jgi:tetratricopeptide (TPR) repeat protein
MAERALEEVRRSGGQAFEQVVLLAAAQVQLGRTEEALATIESVQEIGADHPFTQAVSALVYTSAGQPTDALRCATAVSHTAGATYLDQVFAYVAAAGALAQQGDTTQAELTAEAAVARAMAVGDVVATALATATFRAVTGRAHAAEDDRSQLGEGWERVVHQLVRPADTPVG